VLPRQDVGRALPRAEQTAKIGLSIACCLHAVTNRIDRVGRLDRPALALVVLDDQFEEIEAVGAIAALAVTEGVFLKAAARLQKRGRLFNPRHGFYVAVPPQFLSWQAPPPSWYIDALMQHEGRPSYVGLLKAAELHGATHHAVMEFQVVTDRQFRKIRAGRSWITFHFRKDMKSVRDGVVERKTDTGTMKLSSPELTALDLVRYIHVAGGVDAVATVLNDLGVKINGEKLFAMLPTSTVHARSVSAICSTALDIASKRKRCTTNCRQQSRCLE
jgi:AbiEi antitoxin C-terminal domain